MRLFIGIQPTDEFRSALSVLQDRLRTAGITGRFLDPSNLHMTLAFIGEWKEEVGALLPKVTEPFPITLSHVGCFREAKVLWAGTEPSNPLKSLAKQVCSNLTEAGIPFDPKPFNPHITLIRKPVIPPAIQLEGINVPKATMIVNEVCLYKSEHGDNGMEYTVIGRSSGR